MNLTNNKQEQLAIQQLEKAFKKCSSLGIRFSVMDSTLMHANKRIYKECGKFQRQDEKKVGSCYPTVAYVDDADENYISSVNTFGAMESCGGW